MDEIELRNMMYTAQLEENARPISIRYPRGCGVNSKWRKPFEKIEIGKGRKLAEGSDVAILTIGKSGIFAKKALKKLATKNISAAHYDLRFVKPLDEELLTEVFDQFDSIVTVEDGTIKGGFGSAVLEFMTQNGYASKVKILGIPDRFIDHGTPDDLFKECGIDAKGIANAVVEVLEKSSSRIL